MCFSAPASFTASAILATIGAVCLIRTKTKRLRPLALIPLFFAIQQFAEGIVWLTLPDQTSIALGAKNVFLFFAYAFWPVWIPFSLWLAETHRTRKQILGICVGIGLILACLLALTIPSIEATPYRCSIQYAPSFLDKGLALHTQIYHAALLFYGIAVLLPLFCSSLKRTTMLGILVGVAGVLTYKIDSLFFASMWCFFAALISIDIFFVLQKADKKTKKST